jgi:hypothetical protein
MSGQRADRLRRPRLDPTRPNRIGPESCVAAREDRGEALTGEYTGQPLSLEMNIVSGADAFSIAEGHTDGRVGHGREFL